MSNIFYYRLLGRAEGMEKGENWTKSQNVVEWKEYAHVLHSTEERLVHKSLLPMV